MVNASELCRCTTIFKIQWEWILCSVFTLLAITDGKPYKLSAACSPVARELGMCAYMCKNLVLHRQNSYPTS